MGAVKRVIQKVYRRVVPEFIRDSAIVSTLKKSLLGHRWLYDSEYYDRDVEGAAIRSRATIAHSILEEFNAKNVIDVGCGTGALLEELRNRGCEVFGLEYSDAGLEYCRKRRLDVMKFDLTGNVFDDKRTFDVAVSMEVAEHLPETASGKFVGLLTRLSPIVVFTAAPPGQGGVDHINEQPPSYWIDKFRQRGFDHVEEISQRWREAWKNAGDVESFYHRNLMIFRQSKAN